MAAGEPSIFICYRRGDSPAHAGRLFDSLSGTFGADEVFMDVEGLDPGDEFSAVLEKRIDASDVFIVVVGLQWQPERLSNEGDFVRREITRALTRGVRVMPVLVAGAAFPATETLPESLRPLAGKQLFEMSDRFWRRDYERLLKTIRAELKRGRRARLRKRLAPFFSRKFIGGILAALLIAALLTWVILWVRAPQPKPPINGTTRTEDGVHPLGIDLSHFSTLDWSSPGFNVLGFAFAKATQGKQAVDPKFHNEWDSLAKRGLVRGAYHVWAEGSDPVEQANHFVQTVGPQPGDLLAVDFEAFPFGQKVSDAQLRADLHLFLQRVESRAHCKPFIYTSRAYWNERMDDTFGEYPLWLANYSNHVPDPPKGWTRVAMWQYADKMNLPGFGEVDVNVFNGTLAELRKGGVPKK